MFVLHNINYYQFGTLIEVLIIHSDLIRIYVILHLNDSKRTCIVMYLMKEYFFINDSLLQHII